jgi:hypothetical protein
MVGLRDGGGPGGGTGPLEGEDGDGVFGPGVAVAVLGEDGVERAMYEFDAVVIPLVSRVVVPEIALLVKTRSVSESEKM